MEGEEEGVIFPHCNVPATSSSKVPLLLPWANSNAATPPPPPHRRDTFCNSKSQGATPPLKTFRVKRLLHKTLFSY